VGKRASKRQSAVTDVIFPTLEDQQGKRETGMIKLKILTAAVIFAIVLLPAAFGDKQADLPTPVAASK